MTILVFDNVIQKIFISFPLITFQVERFNRELNFAGKGIVGGSLVYHVPNILVFVTLPSIIFYCVETDWTYLDSVYYVFVSLSTVGFGDLVNGHHGPEGKGGWLFAIYQAFIMLWILLGLAFFLMTFSVIADSFRKQAKNANREMGRRQLIFTIRIFKKLAKKRVKFAPQKSR